MPQIPHTALARIRTRSAGTVAAIAAIAFVAAVTPAQAYTAPAGPELAYYSSSAQVPQAVDARGMQTYLSAEHPQFDLQSYPAYGTLIDDDGNVTTVSFLTQQTNDVVPQLPGLSVAVEGVMVNTGEGATIGGIEGIPDLTMPMIMTKRPWSIHSQSLTLGQKPQFVDARVVKGKIGAAGAVYEFTAHVNSGRADGTGNAAPMDVYIRATDNHGITQWGYGPSGFFPQWIYPGQREQITKRFSGSVGDYLEATDKKLAGQGSYYYTMPLLHVDTFHVTRGGKTVTRGSDGWMLMDAVTQSFGPRANDVVKNDVTWVEFSTQLPGTGQALKIGKVTQASVGTLPYAMLTDPESPALQNESRSATSWGIDDIHIRPVRSSRWVSPQTGKAYYLTYKVTLDGPQSSHLTMKAVFPKQEVAFKGGRSVYEGIYEVSGTLNGEKVTGQAWGEVQPAGSLG